MSTYAWLCRACGHPFENRMSVREKEEWKPRCPVCGSPEVDQQLFGFSVGTGGGSPSPGS